MSGIKRRDFIKMGGMLGLTSVVPSLAHASGPGIDSTAKPDIEIELRARKGTATVIEGTQTAVQGYHGRVLVGDPKTLTVIPGSYLGPVFRVKRGQHVRVHFINDLDEPSIIHWHGLHMPEAMDGHPRYAVRPGERYQYDFIVRNRAGTYWYHPHPEALTASQIYHGLAGVLVIEDDEENALSLPSGDYDLPLVIQDRRLDKANQFQYIGNGMSAMMDRMRGFLGDRILVNGHVDYTHTVEPRPYRLRLLNASNARIYKIALRNGKPLTVIGTDGGLLARPVTVPYVTLAPAQRADLWFDFSHFAPGEELELYSAAFSGTMSMMGGGMMGGAANGTELPVMRFRVSLERRVSYSGRAVLPATLATIPEPDVTAAVNTANPRVFKLTMERMRWGINGREFSMLEVANDEKVRLGTSEVWEFDNTVSAGMMGAMAHPMHIHDVQFQVLSRQGHRAGERHDLAAGYIDQGWRDTVLVMPGERVRLLIKFERYTGLYLYHCHNLEHAAMGMMRNYRIL